LPADRVFPLRFNMELIARLQTDIAPDVFTPRAVYDGRKNLFAPRELPFGGSDSKEVRYATRHMFS
jgi:eukaryotic translation initiation factor 2C